MSEFWTAETIASVTGGSWVVRPKAKDTAPRGAALDAREITPGQVFFALPGERVDGRSFLAQATANGAALTIAARDGIEDFKLGDSMPVLTVDDPARALAELAGAYRDSFTHTRVIGVTGSNGKTTTVRLIDSVLRAGGLTGTHAPKSFNNHLGLPLTLLNAGPGDDYVICEMGTSSPGEIRVLTKIARPDISVIVSIGHAHLEQLGSIEGVALEKCEILRGASIGIIPAGVAELEDAINRCDALGEISLIRVGEHHSADHRVTDVVSTDVATSFTLGSDASSFRIPLLGAHNAHNGGIAALVGSALGVTHEQIRTGLARAQGVRMRLDRRSIELPGGGGSVTVLNDAYNANPDSARAAIRTLVSMPTEGRRVAVLGDLLELGAHSDSAHDELLSELEGLLDRSELEQVVLVGPGMTAAAERSGHADRFRVVPDPTDDAIGSVASMIEPKDLVLLKGSRGIRLERVMDTFESACR